MENREMFLEYMTALGEYHRAKVSKVLMDIYWRGLEPYTDEQCKKAFDLCFTEETYGFPKIPAIKKLMDLPQEITDEHRSIEAWIEVTDKVKSIGNYGTVDFSDAAIGQCIDAIGGWYHLCQCTNEQWTWHQKEFERIYPVIAKNNNNNNNLLLESGRNNRSHELNENNKVEKLRQQAQQLLKEENES